MNTSLTRLLEWLFAGTPAGAGEGLDAALEWSPPWAAWITLALILGGAALVAVVYYRERCGAIRLGAVRLPPPLAKLLLASLRLALMLLVVFMLYELVLRPYRTDLPDLVVLLDDSESMSVVDRYEDARLTALAQRIVNRAGWSEASRLNLARSVLLQRDGALLEDLARRYNLKFYLVSDAARPLSGDRRHLMETLRSLEATGTSSRLGAGLRDALQSQRGRPTAAVVMFTDGITTDGPTLSDVADYARRKATPLHLVALGSDRPTRDLRLADLLADEVVFVDDPVNFDAAVVGAGYEGREVEVTLTRDDHGVVDRRRIAIAADGQSVAVRLTDRPTEEGEFAYTVEVAAQPDEVRTDNNRQTRLVSVRDATLRVLMVQAYPNYEFRYLKALLERQARRSAAAGGRAVELTTVLQEADLEYAAMDETAQRVFPVRRDELFRYDVLVFGDVNPSFLSASVMQNIADFVREKGGGVVFIAGPRYTPLAYRDTPLEELLPIDLASAAPPAPEQPLVESFRVQLTRLGVSAPQMQLADTSADSARIWQQLPGMYWLMETPDLKPGARVLLEAAGRTSADGSPLPVVMTQYVGAGKVVFQATDDTWRWRWRKGDALYGRYWIQTLRHLSRSKLLGADRTAEITTDRTTYLRGEVVRMRVRFFDERLAPAQDDGVTVVLEREGSRTRRVRLTRDTLNRGVFETSLTNLADGIYHAWVATPAFAPEGEAAAEQRQGPPSCNFRIETTNAELARIETDVSDMRLAARTSRGKFYTLANVDELSRSLPRGREVRIESLPPVSIWNSWRVGLAFVGLLVAEWLLRKRAELL